MKTKTLLGVDESDLNKKQWEWQTTSASPIKILRQWPDEMLPIEARPVLSGAKILARDQFKRRIDYED